MTFSFYTFLSRGCVCVCVCVNFLEYTHEFVPNAADRELLQYIIILLLRFKQTRRILYRVINIPEHVDIYFISKRERDLYRVRERFM